MTYVLQVEGIRRAYGGRQVLEAAGVWVRRGGITVLMGRNGDGKTTMMEVALGWRRGERGVVQIDGDRLHDPSLATLARRGVFYLPQRSWLCAAHTVRTHFDAMARHLPASATAGAIDRLHLAALLDRRPHELSGGERRRVEIALAVARRPTCLVADEPFLGISPHDAERVAATFRELARDGCGVLVAGHEVEQLLDLGDYVIWLSAGATCDLGTVAQARRHQQFVREYLGPRHRA